MADKILTNHAAINDAYSQVQGIIEKLSSVQQCLQNVDTTLLAMWAGKGEVAFVTLSNENHAMIKAASVNTEVQNENLSAANQTFEITDANLAGNMGG